MGGPAPDTPNSRPTSSSPPPELTGIVIGGRYEVLGLLGRGGMGAVYEAVHVQLGRRVAIKVLNPALSHRDDYVDRFLREARAASRVRHENVVEVLDFGELEGGSVYSVMEFLDGRDLGQLLREHGKLPWARARGLLLQTVRGLKAVHAQGVIHRDIKPANLFLARDPEDGREVLKVLDFGIARVQSTPNHTAELTNSGQLMGTPAYMAPELARGRDAGPRSEVYSVGVVAYKMLTGEVPFRGDSAFDALFRAATQPTPPLTSYEPSVPPAVEAIVLRSLAKDPQDRHPDMASLYKDLAVLDDLGRPDDAATGITDRVAALPAAYAPLAATSAGAWRVPLFEPTPTTGPHARRTGEWRQTRRTPQWLIASAILAVAFIASAVIVATWDSGAAAPVAHAPASVSPPAPASLRPPPRPSAVPTAPAVPPPPSPIEPSVAVLDDEPEAVAGKRRGRGRSTAAPDPPAGGSEAAPALTDAEVIKRLKRRAQAKCGAVLAGDALRVTFGIGSGGQVLAPRPSRSDSASVCVTQLLRKTTFAPGPMRKEVLTL